MAELPISNEHITQLKTFIELCDKQPSLIDHPQLNFFKNFIEKLGGKVPKSGSDAFAEADNDVPEPMGDYSLQPTDEQIEKSQEKYCEAVSAFNEKDFEKTIKLCTEAILLNPHSSFLFSKRGQAFLSINKPNFCIRDCNRALELNPDSHAAYETRSKGYKMLGKSEEADNDLAKAYKLRVSNVSIMQH